MLILAFLYSSYFKIKMNTFIFSLIFFFSHHAKIYDVL